MSQFDQKTLSILAKLGASTRPELKPIGRPAVTGVQPRLKMAHTPTPLSKMPGGCKPETCPPPSTAYAKIEAPVITPICDTGPLVKDNYAEAMGMAMQLFEQACRCMRGEDMTVVNSECPTTPAWIQQHMDQVQS
jgi:hypothetical protein